MQQRNQKGSIKDGDDDVIEVAPEPKPPREEIILSSADEEDKDQAARNRSARSRSKSEKSSRRSREMAREADRDLRERLSRQRRWEEDGRYWEAQRRRERSAERYHLRLERLRLEEQRREIREERHRLMSIRQEKERDSAWMEKSDEFLKKLGIPLPGSSHLSPERGPDFSFPPPPITGQMRSRSPSPPLPFGRPFDQGQRSLSPVNSRRSRSPRRQLSPSNAAFYIGDKFRDFATGQERRSLSPSERLLGSAAIGSALVSRGAEVKPLFGKPEPAPSWNDSGLARDRTSGLSALNKSLFSSITSREMEATTSRAAAATASGSRMSGLSSLKQAVSRMLNQSGQDIDMRSAGLAETQLPPDILRPGNKARCLLSRTGTGT
jgi:hypothetical protein